MVAVVRYILIRLCNQHGRFSLLLSVAFFIAITARPQTHTNIHRNFDIEMARYGATSLDTTFLPTVIFTIPPWKKDHFPEQRDTLYVIGISDPGLQDSIARAPAFFRALALGSMAHETEGDHFSDFYSQGQKSGTDSKYEEIYRFSSVFSNNVPTPTILKKECHPYRVKNKDDNPEN